MDQYIFGNEIPPKIDYENERITIVERLILHKIGEELKVSISSRTGILEYYEDTLDKIEISTPEAGDIFASEDGYRCRFRLGDGNWHDQIHIQRFSGANAKNSSANISQSSVEQAIWSKWYEREPDILTDKTNELQRECNVRFLEAQKELNITSTTQLNFNPTKEQEYEALRIKLPNSKPNATEEELKASMGAAKIESKKNRIEQDYQTAYKNLLAQGVKRIAVDFAIREIKQTAKDKIVSIILNK
ncbi:hypothetical protein ACIOUG_06175 [Pseudomonas sp. NPDC087803]|uniref:hypothetical protein n=1 Tax=Pseudomonas sp. NPDC087803 TaxID=3364448 RepID=UPI003810E698